MHLIPHRSWVTFISIGNKYYKVVHDILLTIHMYIYTSNQKDTRQSVVNNMHKRLRVIKHWRYTVLSTLLKYNQRESKVQRMSICASSIITKRYYDIFNNRLIDNRKHTSSTEKGLNCLLNLGNIRRVLVFLLQLAGSLSTILWIRFERLLIIVVLVCFMFQYNYVSSKRWIVLLK